MKTSRMPHLVLGLATALASSLIMASGCGKKDVPTDVPAPATTEGATPQHAPGEEAASGRRDLAQAPEPKPEVAPTAAPPLAGPFASAGLHAVPKGAPFVLVGAPKKFMDALGYEGLLEKYGALLGDFGEQMVEVSGKDFFKLATWGEIGVDLAAPMGVFMTELDTQGFVSFVGLSDSAKLVAFMSEIAKKLEAPLGVEKLGEATLLTLGERDRNAWLVRDGMLFAVTMMRGNGATAIAKEILNRKPGDSITALPELAAAVDGLGADEMGVFVQLKSILEKTLLARAEERAEPAPPPFERELAEAKAAGDAATVARLESAIAEENQYLERSKKRRAAELELAKTVVGQLSYLAAGLDIAERSAEIRVRLPLTQGGMLAGLFKNATETQSILKATKQEPLLVLSGQVDPARYLELIEKLMQADGDDLADVRKGLQEALGLDFDKDVVGALTGEIGFAVTGDLATLMKSEDPQMALGGAFVLGLRSDTALKALAGKLATLEGVDQFVKWDAAASTLTVALPERRPIQVVIEGNRLLASTDVDTSARLAGGQSFVSEIKNPKLQALFEKKDVAAMFAMQHSFLGAWFMAMGGRGSYAPPLPADAGPEAKAKLVEIAKLDAEIQPLRAAQEEKRMKPIIDVFEKLGTFAETVSMDAQGASVTLGVYTKGATVPEVVAAIVAMALEMEREVEQSDDDKRLRELEDKRWKLESELWDLDRPKTEVIPDPE